MTAITEPMQIRQGPLTKAEIDERVQWLWDNLSRTDVTSGDWRAIPSDSDPSRAWLRVTFNYPEDKAYYRLTWGSGS